MPTARQTPSETNASRPAAAQARLLVAEDHGLNQILMSKLLKRMGIGYFEIVGTGLDALERYDAAAWDVILMDCHMPQMNGYEAAAEIRARERSTAAHVPIIAMTANAMDDDADKCLSAGMDAYLSKPITIEEFRDMLGQWVDFDAGGIKF